MAVGGIFAAGAAIVGAFVKIHEEEKRQKLALMETRRLGLAGRREPSVEDVPGSSSVEIPPHDGSEELLDDSNGMAADLVSSQFGKQIGITIDTAIISGTGTGQPTGIRNTAGVTSTAVDGQNGKALYDSVLKAASRLGEDFLVPDTLVVHPRDLVKYGLVTDTAGRYIFEAASPGCCVAAASTLSSTRTSPRTWGRARTRRS